MAISSYFFSAFHPLPNLTLFQFPNKVYISTHIDIVSKDRLASPGDAGSAAPEVELPISAIASQRFALFQVTSCYREMPWSVSIASGRPRKDRRKIPFSFLKYKKNWLCDMQHSQVQVLCSHKTISVRKLSSPETS